jgi:hypothetical protein
MVTHCVDAIQLFIPCTLAIHQWTHEQMDSWWKGRRKYIGSTTGTTTYASLQTIHMFIIAFFAIVSKEIITFKHSHIRKQIPETPEPFQKSDPQNCISPEYSWS